MTLLLWPAQCLALVAWPNKVFLRSPQVLDSLCKRCSHSVLLGRSARATYPEALVVEPEVAVQVVEPEVAVLQGVEPSVAVFQKAKAKGI